MRSGAQNQHKPAHKKCNSERTSRWILSQLFIKVSRITTLSIGFTSCRIAEAEGKPLSI